MPRTTSDPSLDSPLLAATPSVLERTIAILLPHAAQHKPDIVRCFKEAGLKIMDEFEWEADETVVILDLGITDEGLKKAFGEESDGQPCHVWCLERRRVVEVVTSLVGDEDVDYAKQHAPDSFRALYGSSPSSIVVWTPSSLAVAEPLLELFFASLEPLSTASTNAVYPPHLSNDQEGTPETDFVGTPEEEHVPSFHRPRVVEAGTVGLGIRDNENLVFKGGFKARAAPATTHKPERAVRQSRASLLRQGVDPSSVLPPRTSSTQPSDFTTIPGHKRSPTNLHIDVASIREPLLPVRASRASLIRQGSDVPPPRPKRAPSSAAESFVDTPGHKRVGMVVEVESVKRPSFEPRQSRASLLRAGGGNEGALKESIVTSVRKNKTSEEIRVERREEEKLKKQRRKSEMPGGMISSTAPPPFAPRQTKASLLRTGVEPALSAPTSLAGGPGLAHQRSSSSFVSSANTGSIRSNASSFARPASAADSRRSITSTRPSIIYAFSSDTTPPDVDKPTPSLPRVAPVASIRPPSVTPRPNRAALLRQGQPLPAPTPRNNSSTTPGGEEYNPFAQIPGHKRRESIAVASTSQPDIAPRQNRAAFLRMGGTPAPTPQRPASSIGLVSSTRTATNVDQTPSSLSSSTTATLAHKRRESSHSFQPPTITPRLNRAATLRQGGTPAPARPPPSSFNKSFQGTTTTRSGASTPVNIEKKEPVVARAPDIEPRQNRAQELRMKKRASMAL